MATYSEKIKAAAARRKARLAYDKLTPEKKREHEAALAEWQAAMDAWMLAKNSGAPHTLCPPRKPQPW